MCVQIHEDWDLAADMHRAGWGIIYPLIIHNKHLDLHKYNKAVGLDAIVVGESKEPVDAATAKQKKTELKKVKREEQSDDERGGPEMNKGIIELREHLKAKAKKPCHS